MESRPRTIGSHSVGFSSASRLNDEASNQACFRKVRGILNKITPEKFDKLSEALLGLGLNSQALLKGVILLIFEKALEEPKYSSMYAQLCKKLSTKLPNFEPAGSASNGPHFTTLGPQGTTAPNSSINNANDPNNNTFCRLLLVKCSSEFENRRKATKDFGDGHLSEEDEEARSIAKAKMLGNIKFICELGRQLLVQENILHACIKELCSKRRTETIQNKTEDLECLCQIMKTVGRLLDTEKAKPLMDQYFDRIRIYAQSEELPARITFMLRDVMELRQNKWVPRRVQREQNPKTIGQIREEAAKDFGGYIPTPNFGGNSNSGHTRFGDHGHGQNNFNFQTSYPQFSNYITMKSPLYGHQGSPLNVGKQSQRAIDDMGYFANLGGGPGTISDFGIGGGGGGNDRGGGRRGSGNNSNNRQSGHGGNSPDVVLPIGYNQHVPGHMPYRGSTSTESKRGGRGDRDRDRQTNNNNQNRPGDRGRGPNDGRGDSNSDHIGPRLQRKTQSPSQGGQRPGQNITILSKNNPLIGLPLGGTLNEKEISLRPAQNSMVVNNVFGRQAVMANAAAEPSKAGDRQSPLLITTSSARGSPVTVDNSGVSTSANNAKNSGSNPTQSAKEVLLKKAEEAVNDLGDDQSNVEDVVGKFKELKIQKNFKLDVLITIMKTSMSKSDQERERASKLLTKLNNENIITAHFFSDAFKHLLKNIGDLETDVPRVKSHLAGLIARAVIEDIIDVKDARALTEDYYPMFLLVLQQMNTIQGNTWLAALLQEAKIDLMSTLPEADRQKEQLADVLRDRELSFLYPLLRVESEMVKQLADSELTPNGLYKWIKENVDAPLQATPGFVRLLFSLLTTTIVEKAKSTGSDVFNGDDSHTSDASSTGSPASLSSGPTTASEKQEKELLATYTRVLNAFLEEKLALQLAALYSLQSTCHELGFPKGMLLRWFMALYDLEIIEEEVFLKWKEDINDEFPGKGQALFQVNTWLTWLAETEEGSDEEDEEAEPTPVAPKLI